jgi:diguanylate cyclase (GGDEF)-like protein
MTLAYKENAKNIAERIRLAVEKQIVHTQEPISYTVSIGISTKIPAHKNDYENMIIEADNNLYQAKKNGRNQVVA